MTVKLANLSAQFTRSDIKYVGIGLHITDGASAPSSKILNFSVNSNNKFSIDKEGTVEINGNVADDVDLLAIHERNQELVYITNNVAAMNTTNYVKSYAEGYLELDDNPDENWLSDLVVDLSKASVFGCLANNVNSISFIQPNTLHGKDEAYSCSIIFYYAPNFPRANIWRDANVMWSYGYPPRQKSYAYEGPMILTFMSTSVENPTIWYGTITGVDYRGGEFD